MLSGWPRLRPLGVELGVEAPTAEALSRSPAAWMAHKIVSAEANSAKDLKRKFAEHNDGVFFQPNCVNHFFLYTTRHIVRSGTREDENNNLNSVVVRDIT